MMNEDKKFDADVQFMIKALVPILSLSKAGVGMTAMCRLLGIILAENPNNIEHNLTVIANLVAETLKANLDNGK